MSSCSQRHSTRASFSISATLLTVALNKHATLRDDCTRLGVGRLSLSRVNPVPKTLSVQGQQAGHPAWRRQRGITEHGQRYRRKSNHALLIDGMYQCMPNMRDLPFSSSLEFGTGRDRGDPGIQKQVLFLNFERVQRQNRYNKILANTLCSRSQEWYFLDLLRHTVKM
jgi:hypothetical protein